MLQGLNNTISVTRGTEGAIDTIGGATVSEATVYTGVKCRISNPNRGDFGRLEQMEGIDWTRVVKMVVWPSSSYTIYPGDVVRPGLGRYANSRFIVLDVKQDSLIHTVKRAHIELICERYDQARTKQ